MEPQIRSMSMDIVQRAAGKRESAQRYHRREQPRARHA